MSVLEEKPTEILPELPQNASTRDVFDLCVSLLSLKKANFKEMKSAQMQGLGLGLNFEYALAIPGSKGPLSHFIFMVISRPDQVLLLDYSKAFDKVHDENSMDLSSLAMVYTKDEMIGTWFHIRHKQFENLILRCTVYSGSGTGFANQIWASCAHLDQHFKAKVTPLLSQQSQPIEVNLQRLVKLHLDHLGFKKVKEMLTSNGNPAFLVVLSNESDSVDESWKRFPMRFEIEKSGIVTIRVYFSIHDKANVFTDKMGKVVKTFVSRLNPHISEGFYSLDSSSNQLHLLFKLYYSPFSDDQIKTMLQSYYEAAISIYKWSAWAFVRLVQLREGRNTTKFSIGELREILELTIGRSPSERKCTVLSYWKEGERFEWDRKMMERMKKCCDISSYLLPDPFLILPQDRTIKVYTDSSLRSLQSILQEGDAAYVLNPVFRLLEICGKEGIFPSLNMLKFKPTPMKLVLVPDKGFGRSRKTVFSEILTAAMKSNFSAEAKLSFRPETSLLYFNPEYFEKAFRTDVGSKVGTRMGNTRYILWKLRVPFLTKQFISRLEGYVATSRSRTGDSSIKGLVSTPSTKFELPASFDRDELTEGENYYLVEGNIYDHISVLEDLQDFSIMKKLAFEIRKLHDSGWFHGFLSPGTVRKRAKRPDEVVLVLPGLHWKYLEVLYPAIPENFKDFVAPEIAKTYETKEIPFPRDLLKKADSFSFAKLLLLWFPLLAEHSPSVLQAITCSWTQRPSIEQMIEDVELDRPTVLPSGLVESEKMVENAREKTTFSTSGPSGCCESEKTVENQHLQ